MGWEDEIVGLDVASAGVVVSDRIEKEAAGQIDLRDALEASKLASHPYSSHPKEWPPQLEVVETRELPPVLIERYNASGGEGTASCGIFPEICRAWASVDNSLFLWRFDSWDGQCCEYSGEDHAICAVGLVRPKPGIFLEAIQYLLVLATPVELILIGVFCTGNEDGTDRYAELSLQALPEYTIASDGVIMTCITCTDRGRIFLAGRDGHIYEMQYSAGSGWHKCCRKVCLTAGLGSLVSRWVLSNALKFGSVDPVVAMVVDNERHILYSRTEDMKLQVFDLGANGDGPFKRVAEEKNLIDPQETQYGGRRSAGSRANTLAAKPSIVCVAPLSIMESKWLHAVAVLSDGRRLYLTTTGGNDCLTGQSNAHQRPCCLEVLTSRPSPPLGVGSGLTFGTMSATSRTQADDLALKVETAFYSAGTFILSDLSAPALSYLLIANRDSSVQSLVSGSFGMTATSSCALREIVSSLPVEGRMLFAADVLCMPDTGVAVQSLYSDTEGFSFLGSRESCEKAVRKLWARGDLSIQHILPRRRIVVFGTMGMMEVVFNRPVDILRRLLESNSPRPQIEDFFKHFGAGEAASMCLMIAAKLVDHEENLISNTVAEKAAEVFEDPRLIRMPQLDGSTALLNTRTSVDGFSMGQVVQEAEPMFSGVHEGLCLCSSRLLFPIWELPFLIVCREVGPVADFNEGLIVCRLSVEAMQVLESKIRSLEQFMRSRRNQKRGLYDYVAGLGDITSSIVYSESGAHSQSASRNSFVPHSQNAEPRDAMAPNKRLRLPHSSAEVAAMEVRAIECLRRLLRRSSEALFLLQLISKHHATRLVQSLDDYLRQKLVHMTFHQLVCSQEGDQLAMQLISGLMKYYIGPDSRGTVDDMSMRLQEGCPSYYNESDYKYFLAIDYLERAAATHNSEERENLARDAFGLLSKIPQHVDLNTVCKRFEDLRFYEALVRLPLQKAQTLDPEGDALNDKIDPGNRDNALAQREQCYNIIINALGSLAQKGTQTEFSASVRFSGMRSVLDQATRDKYIHQIIQLSVQWPDRAFHKYLYRTLIVLGLENELLEYGGPDLVLFLQNAGRKPTEEVQAVTAITRMASAMRDLEAPIASSHTKYLDLLAKYYVLKRQHILAAHILYRLAERQCSDVGEAPTLEQRHQYLSNAVLQAKSAINNDNLVRSTRKTIDDGLLDMLEAKLTVLQFQMKIKEELEATASRFEDLPSTSVSPPGDPLHTSLMVDCNIAKDANNKAKELTLELKSITQLYNEYAVPFKLWEICLEMLNFANYSGDADSKIVREIWARLLDQALSRGGVAEACSVLKRVGSNLYPGDGACLPLETLCLHLEKAALERLESGVELVGDEDIAGALLAACKGAQEPVLSIYDQLLSNRAVLPSPALRLRLLRSVLGILREWATSALAYRMGTTTAGTSIIFGGTSALEQRTVINQGIRDKITTAANRYMTEVRRLALPQSQTAAVYQGFRELEEELLHSTWNHTDIFLHIPLNLA